MVADFDSSISISLFDSLVDTWRGDREGLKHLIRWAAHRAELSTDEELCIFDAAAHAFTKGCNDNPQALGVLKERAMNDPEPGIRSAALRAIILGFREPEAFDFLMDRAVSDPEPEVRASAIDSMMVFWSDIVDIHELVEQRAVSDPEPAVRAAAFVAW